MKKTYSFVLLAALVALGLGLFARYEGIETPLHFGEKPVRLLFVGDMMFDRTVRMKIDEKGFDYIFSCVAERFAGYDAVIGNLEGPITDNPSVSAGSVIETPENYTFTFAPLTASGLARSNVSIISLGNNHIGNMGSTGIAQTQEYITRAGGHYFGGLLGDSPAYLSEIRGEKIAFISYNEFGGASIADTALQIAKEKQAGYVPIVFAHWGQEYATTSTPTARSIAKEFADAGGGLIVGAHPHVVQEKEMVGKTPVYYSLGNFIFDQYWDDSVTHGLAVEVEIKGGKVHVVAEHQTVFGRDRRPCFVE